ncbi:hypothetical protein [Acetilactobacillus jinshanensis]|uniref:Uncharacterized protein n=1 Tax=Acetilactobacillus jinshanensis TaxID=1720083 RepID=A0A4P6ZM03_9LACO|nr:hypothetical protein [Acetilactobacillus jinshanensis]QBP18442.1 hypothetical protein ELX58_04675 [Acetilactobacillus jinshanensis]URL61314.1 hypothetical protein HGK75_04785 [uncultured bacterium]
MVISKHTKPFLLNLANIRIIYSTPEWSGTDRYFMDAIEQAINDGVGNHDPAHKWYLVSAPDYDPSKANSKIAPGRDLANQYAANYDYDQKQTFIYHRKRHHSRKIRIKSASQKDIKNNPTISELIKKAKK